MSEFNEFNEDNKMAEGGGCESFWNEIYKKAFPDMIRNRKGQQGKCESQEQGIDRIIELSNGKILKLDEKVRREKWPDFALEFISNDKKNTPGWMEKNLLINYLAYAFLPTKTAYLLDWKKLKRVWEKYKEDWKKKYFIAEANNYNSYGEYLYTTHSVCVPINKVLSEIKWYSTNGSDDIIIIEL